MLRPSPSSPLFSRERREDWREARPQDHRGPVAGWYWSAGSVGRIHGRLVPLMTALEVRLLYGPCRGNGNPREAIPSPCRSQRAHIHSPADLSSPFLCHALHDLIWEHRSSLRNEMVRTGTQVDAVLDAELQDFGREVARRHENNDVLFYPSDLVSTPRRTKNRTLQRAYARRGHCRVYEAQWARS